MKRLLLVANVAKEHVLKFHVPTIKHLANEGWHVDVACGGKEEIPFCNRQYELPIDRSPLRTNFIKAIRILRDIINEEQYDIVYCHTSVGGVVGRLAAIPAHKRGTRVVKFAHGTYFFKGAPISNWVYFPIYKILSWVTDVIITITKEDYEFTHRHFSHAKTYYVPGIGIDPSRFIITNRERTRADYRKQLAIPENATVLIYVAELIKNKNQTLLMDSLKYVLKIKSDVYLILVGPDHTNGKFKVYAEQLGVACKVRFLGWRDDIKELYAMSDICTASSIREGLGLNLIEAMVCGLPVVATANSGHRAVIENGKNGILVPIGDAKELACQIIRLANTPHFCSKLVNNSLLDIDKYYNQSVLKRINEILNEQL